MGRRSAAAGGLTPGGSAATLERAWRDEWGRLLALLVARFRDLEIAEDALAGAFEAAARTWPRDGVPDNPPAWLLTTARHRALDRLRSKQSADRALPMLIAEHAATTGPAKEPGDDELRLLLLTCHPALAPESQAALALRLVLGLPTAEIARLFLISEATMAARITRAKKKIATAGLPFAIPDEDLLPARVETAARAIYLCFTAGYAPGNGADVVRRDLAGEAIRLARVLESLLSRRSDARPVVRALLALMLLQHSRRDARVDADGALVLLADQDRGRWHLDEIEEALALLRPLPPADGYAEELRQQAVIAARHAIAVHPDDTDWPAIAHDYLGLERLTGSPVVRLNRAVAVAEADGPRAGLTLLEGLDELLPRSHRLPAVRAELLTRAGRPAEASAELTRAIELCRNELELAHLRARLAALSG